MIALLGAVLMTTLAVVLVGGYFGGSTGKLAQWIPADVGIYAELPDLPAALVAFSELDIVDDSRLDADRRVDRLVKGISETFEVDEDTARAVTEDIESVALALRDPDESSEGALLIRFARGSGMTEMLDSPRFREGERVGDSGRRYGLWKREAEQGHRIEPGWRLTAAQMSFDKAGDDLTLVWFEDHNLLVAGTPGFIEDIADVIDEGEPSLADDEAFRSANFEPGASSIYYVQLEHLFQSSDERRFAREFFHDVEGIASSTWAEDVGFVTATRGVLRGSGIPTIEQPAPIDLGLLRRLPASTVGYLAVSTDYWLSRELDHQLETTLGRTFGGLGSLVRSSIASKARALVEDQIGGEVVIALAVSDELRGNLPRTPDRLVDQVTIGLVLPIEQREEFMRSMGEIAGFVSQSPFGTMGYTISRDGDSMLASPKDSTAPYIRLALLDDVAVVAAGGEAMTRRFIEDIEGEGRQLGSLPAHARAIEALSSDAHAIVWLDTGRMAADLVDADAVFDRFEQWLEISPRVLILDGDERATFAATLHVDVEDEGWNVELKVLNYSLLSIAPVFTEVFDQTLGRLSRSRSMLGSSDEPNGMHPFSSPRSRPTNPWGL